jgi:hypothetical protein
VALLRPVSEGQGWSDSPGVRPDWYDEGQGFNSSSRNDVEHLDRVFTAMEREVV